MSKAKTNNLKTLAEFKDEFYGKKELKNVINQKKGMNSSNLAH